MDRVAAMDPPITNSNPIEDSTIHDISQTLITLVVSRATHGIEEIDRIIICDETVAFSYS
ncbi:7869_t:CDS:2 [Cetraspora pellucida]|uniref:7869_t:CDS:1 n=1 Tax=Cetraspora pellucida TaxID=1433469 RepID=A0A9N9NLF1_9GLOM|nr:7869_t:CDS:2 [Cetraspora pellucida]